MGSGMSSPLSSCCLVSPGLSASGPRVRQPSAAEKEKECGSVGRATRQVQLYSPHLMTHTGGPGISFSVESRSEPPWVDLENSK